MSPSGSNPGGSGESAPASRNFAHQLGGQIFVLLAKQIQSGKYEVPLLPQVAIRVSEMSRMAEVPFDKIANLIISDQALSANILRVANSAFFRRGNPCDSIPAALVRLGTSTIREITLALSVRAKLFKPGRFNDVFEQLWRHASGVGGAARVVAQIAGKNADGAFLCGLIHDIGKPIALNTAIEIGNLQEIPDAEIRGALPRVFTAFHQQIAGRAAKAWNFPDWVCEAVRFHEEPNNATDFRKETWLVHIADRMVKALDTSAGAEPARFVPDEVAASGMTPEQMERASAKVAELWAQKEMSVV